MIFKRQFLYRINFSWVKGHNVHVCIEIYLCIAGIHYVGEMNKGYWARTLLDQLTEGQVDWVPMDQDFDVVCEFSYHQNFEIQL